MTSLTILSFFGGIMLLLYGMKVVGQGLQKAAGAKLRGFLLTATNNRFKGVAVGAATTALMQSSSATTVMLVGFVGSGLMGLAETMGVILGADIGTTLTVQLLAFKVYDYAVGMIGVGLAIRFMAGSGPLREGGHVLLGFGFVFLSLKILMDAFAPLAEDPVMGEIILGVGRDPLAGIIVAALLTAVFQSSAATLGLAITAAHSGVLTIDAAMPIVLGANIGTCSTAVLSSMGAPVDAKRVALAHILFKVLGVIIVLPFLGVFTDLVAAVSSDPARQVAFAHTVFNIAIAVTFLPFTGPFTRLVQYLLPQRVEERRFGPRYLDPLVLTSSSLALGQATREALRLADIVQEMLRSSIEVFKRDDKGLVEKLEETDNDVDLLDREIKLYLAKLSRESLSEEQVRRELEIMAFTNNLENIGDVIDKNLMDLARKKIKKQHSFSEEGTGEIAELHAKVMENFELGVAAFTSSDPELARRLLDHKAKIAGLEREMREAHIERLHRGLKESMDTSSIHLDVLSNLKRINSYITNVAYQIVERERKE
ncbi:MAG: Na/Pi cotransporter family protein [Thermodesulfobacteriota bacterium]